MQDEKLGDDVPPNNNRIKIKSKDEALEFLFKALKVANSLFVEGKDAGRLGAIEALNSVVQFLMFFKGTTDLRQPFTALLNALENLNNGQVLPLLERQRRSGRSPASAAKDSHKALAECTVRRLRETGLGKKEAYEKVAQVCREAGIKPGRKGRDSPSQEPEITGRTVRGWCEKIAEDVGRHLQAAQTLDRLRQSQTPEAQAITQAIKSEQKEAARNGLLQGLRLSLVQMRASEH
jgi:hypothetical protein